MIYPIVLYPTAILLQPAKPVLKFNKKLREVVGNMFETMYASEGMGLAAPQVGMSARIVVADTTNGKGNYGKILMVNPMLLVKSPQKVVGEEGCLSLPGELYSVERHETVKVRYQVLDGSWSEQTFSGMRSIVVQHELDHLEGRLVNQVGEKKLF